MPTDVAIIGVGETDPVRADPRSMGKMVADAIHRALADAGLRADQLDGFVSESATMPSAMPAEKVVAALGIAMPEAPFIAYGLHYGAGLVAAPELAQWALATGRANYVVCWYGHHLSRHEQGPRALYANDPLKADLEMPSGWFGQPVYFAGIAERYAYEYGLPAEALAAVAMEARGHASRTPGSLKPKPLDLDGYLASPMISTPLRGADCALVNDGAVAFVMTTSERARDHRHPVVRARGVGVGATSVPGDTWFTQNADYLTTPAAVSGANAFARAGLTPNDVDFVELYDCFSINTILQYEDLGFAAKGEGAQFAIDKGSGPGNRLPTNTHGGLLAHSFMLGGGHVIEAVRQLRHERGDTQVADARIGLVTALGVPHHSTLILERM